MMRHGHKFELAEVYDGPFCSWILMFWVSAVLFCLLFWWCMFKLVLPSASDFQDSVSSWISLLMAMLGR